MSKLNDFQTIVKGLLNEAGSAVVRSYFFKSGANNNEDDEHWHEGVKDFTERCQSLCVNYSHEDNTGGEGQGDEYWSIYKFFDAEGHECFVKFDGYYASYSGSDYSDFFFVEPKEKTITVYVKA